MALCSNLVVRRSAYLAASQQLQRELQDSSLVVRRSAYLVASQQLQRLQIAKEEVRTDPDEWKRWTFEAYCTNWQSRYSLVDIEAYWLECCSPFVPDAFFGSCPCMPSPHFEAPDPCLDSRRMDVFGAWDGEEDFENEYSEEDWEDEDVEEEFVEDAEDQETESAQQMEVSAEHVKDVEHVQVVPQAACEYLGVIQTLETCKDPLRLVEDVASKPCAEDKTIDAALSPSRTKEAHALPCKGLLTVPSPLRARAPGGC